MDVLEVLRRNEGKTLEFKRDLSTTTGLLKTVVAFANTSGGTIVIGVEDRTRRVVGVAEPLDLEERVASLISDSITPRILPDLEVLAYRRTHVLAVTVHPSSSRPHRLTSVDSGHGTYVRVGSTNRLADEALMAEMRRFSAGESFDERPMTELDSEAIDFRAASESFAPVRPLARSDLATLRLLVRYGAKFVPTVGGILLFGIDRLRHFPDAWIQVGRFRGTTKATIVDHAELRMGLLPAIEAAIAFVEKHSIQGVTIDDVRHKAAWSLPPAAVREAVVNAVAHADYSQTGAPIRIAIFDDRLEVENQGLLPFGLTLSDLPLGVSKLRNRVLGRVLHELGFVEQWGSGIQRMIAVCKEAGQAAPEFEEVGFRFRVTLRLPRIRARSPALDPTDRAILEVIQKTNGIGTSAIAKSIRLTSRATRTRLADLVARGLVREIGTGPQDPRRRYYSTDGS